jgi:uncharacterized protein
MAAVNDNLLAVMEKNYCAQIAAEFRWTQRQVEATLHLLDDGATVPFIARYRKEATGQLDEIAITRIRDRVHQLRELDKRRQTVLQSIHEQGKLTGALKQKILSAETLSVLEDIYLPYRPKRRTRALIAKEKGLEPLAHVLFEQKGMDPSQEAAHYVNPSKGIHSCDEALSGARDIMAEWMNEDGQARDRLRRLFFDRAIIRSQVIKGKEKDGIKYKDYFEWQELAKNAPSHRILAVRRAEKEAFLTVRILPPEDEAIAILENLFVKTKGGDGQQVHMAVVDSYKRLLSLSLETELRMELKRRADQEAIEIFKSNLRELLMSPPLGQKRVMAIDPGYRTGCKLVCLDEQGKFLHNDTIYITDSPKKREEAAVLVEGLCARFKPEVIVVGNGTASRETEDFIRGLKLPEGVQVVLVNESGASIYSASEAAREEFPEHDVTVRGSVSIGRRLMDPLAELVKIDPKSIGVGQYQHDVDQALLKEGLDDVVMSCVNHVGVELNTASKQLLVYVSGLGPVRAQAIVDYRNTSGPFRNREELRNVSGLGSKAFEQAAGFLRIRGGLNPLDASAVHPESYAIVDRIAADLGCALGDLMGNDNVLRRICIEKYVTDSVGLPTLLDIKNELAKPGRDPREVFQLFSYQEGVHAVEDLRPGMTLPGVVTNVTAFGAFVDIGVHHDGLVHISQLADRYIKDPHNVVRVHQKVAVKVIEVDLERKRIALSLRKKAG